MTLQVVFSNIQNIARIVKCKKKQCLKGILILGDPPSLTTIALRELCAVKPNVKGFHPVVSDVLK